MHNAFIFFIIYVAGQTVVHEDDFGGIAAASSAAAAAAVADPVPAPEEDEDVDVDEDVDEDMPLSAAGENDAAIEAENTNQDTELPPPPSTDNADNADNSGIVDIVNSSFDNAVDAAVAAVEKVAVATYGAHSIGNLVAEEDSPLTAPREDMSVDGNNSAPATPVASTSIDDPALLLPEDLLPEPVDNSAADSASDNQFFT
ncbi:hypothetical protein GGI21_000642 [Coemansia aciculifera]|uniref:Uncharacterized protein n=1 Tax=Coemansia aciculifera TaxID=417176 RepID=A0ACC1LTE0_9FUNG|nr:hypothetical protein IWW38_006261 [Coemansia aciculifera]KAJ2910665.1 hypothetical protein GGI21_000642 [Coemansia aciculifera]